MSRCEFSFSDGRVCWRTNGHDANHEPMPPGWETSGACIEEVSAVMWGVFQADNYEPRPIAIFPDKSSADEYCAEYHPHDHVVLRCDVAMTVQNGANDIPWVLEHRTSYVAGTESLTFKRPGAGEVCYVTINKETKEIQSFEPMGTTLDEATVRRLLG
jgi:hypothetical protein